MNGHIELEQLGLVLVRVGCPVLESRPLAGVYHTMEEHLEIASSLTSPADSSDRLPDSVRRNIFSILIESPVAISKRRLLALQQLNAQVDALASDEADLRAKMHPDVESVTRGKALAVFRHLLEKTGFPDLSIISGRTCSAQVKLHGHH